MDRFFHHCDSEENKPTAKKAVAAEKASVAVSKHGKKLQELEVRVKEVMGAGKHFEKLGKKLFGDLKKYAKVLGESSFPESLLQFLQDSRVLDNSQLSELARTFLESHPQERQMVFGEDCEEESTNVQQHTKPAEEPVSMSLEKIMQIKNDREKAEMLVQFSNVVKSEEEGAECALALLAILHGQKDVERMIATITKLIPCLTADNRYAQTFRTSIDTYIGKIYDRMEEKDNAIYEELLELLEPLEPKTVALRKQEFSAFKLGRPVDSDVPAFRLLCLVRAGNWGEAREYYISHTSECLSMQGKPGYALFSINRTVLQIQKELADLAIANEDYKFAFDQLVFCEDHHADVPRAKLYALCVVLNRAIIGHPLFQQFLVEFRALDDNRLLLESQDSTMEVFRSFYLLGVYDYLGAAAIIQKHRGFNPQEILKKTCLAMAHGKATE